MNEKERAAWTREIVQMVACMKGVSQIDVRFERKEVRKGKGWVYVLAPYVLLRFGGAETSE